MMRFAVIMMLAGCFGGAGGGGNWTSTTTAKPAETAPGSSSGTISNYSPPRSGSCANRVQGAWDVLAHLPEGDVTYILELFSDGSTGHHDYVFTNGTKEGPDLNKNDNDRWSVENGMVLFDFNDRYVKYSGACPGGDSMSGDAVNVNNVTFTWEANRHR